MGNAIMIPKSIYVGFKGGYSTYTGKLAYIIYFDEHGKLRKEKSWNSWRDQTIQPEQYDNVPTKGFLLNKNVGGYQDHYMRQTYIRVYDPRGFEFEITVPNLLYILEYTNSTKGKKLEGEFVYSWYGTELVLLPTDAPEYLELKKLSEKRFKNESITAKDLKDGYVYRDKNGNELVYLGKYMYYDVTQERTYSPEQAQYYSEEKGKHFWFEPVDNNPDFGATDHLRYSYPHPLSIINFSATVNGYIARKSIPKGYILEQVSDEIVKDFADRYERVMKCSNFTKVAPEKDKYIPWIESDLLQWISNNYNRARFHTNIYGDWRYIHIEKRDNKFVCFADDGTHRYKDICTCDTLGEIMQKFAPHYRNCFLQTGQLCMEDHGQTYY